MLDVMNMLGISNSLIRVIERRQTMDLVWMAAGEPAPPPPTPRARRPRRALAPRGRAATTAARGFVSPRFASAGTREEERAPILVRRDRLAR